MKGNIKKLTVFGMIAAMAMLTVVSTESAGQNLGNFIIQGHYAVTGTNQCVIGFFNADNSPTQIVATLAGYNEGIYTFNMDGSGYFVGLSHSVIDPDQALVGQTYGASYSTYKFTYRVTEGGAISFRSVPCTYCGGCPSLPNPVHPDCSKCAGINDPIPLTGVISPDGMSLNVTCGGPIYLHPCDSYGGSLISGAPSFACDIFFTGFKVPNTYALPTIY